MTLFAREVQHVDSAWVKYYINTIQLISVLAELVLIVDSDCTHDVLSSESSVYCVMCVTTSVVVRGDLSLHVHTAVDLDDLTAYVA